MLGGARAGGNGLFVAMLVELPDRCGFEGFRLRGEQAKN
jgi:hypothetical protein